VKIWICAYREWARSIYSLIQDDYDCELITSRKSFMDCTHRFSLGDKIFFLGWSWMVPEEIIETYECICLHPSPLPRYRGGSPLQHQIINGETTSAVTYFKMTSRLDSGHILFQQEISLRGSLKDILRRLAAVGTAGLVRILVEEPPPQPQDESRATFFKRRHPAESEIEIIDFSRLTSRQLSDKIRALQDPYPNAYVVCGDGKKLFIKEAFCEE